MDETAIPLRKSQLFKFEKKNWAACEQLENPHSFADREKGALQNKTVTLPFFEYAKGSEIWRLWKAIRQNEVTTHHFVANILHMWYIYIKHIRMKKNILCMKGIRFELERMRENETGI